MKRTVAGEIEIGLPKRIWAASFSEAEHPGETERMVLERVKMMHRKRAQTGEVKGEKKKEGMREPKSMHERKRRAE